MPQSPEREDLPNVELPIPIIDIPLDDEAELNLKIDVGISNNQPVVDGGSIGVTFKF